MSHRKDENRNIVKLEHLRRYGKRCWICGRKFSAKSDLTLHHIIKWADCHITTLENTSILCEDCHRKVHHYELCNPDKYRRINNYLTHFRCRQ